MARTADQLRRRALRLEWATNGWNAMEVVVTISLGIQAGSLALIAFGSTRSSRFSLPPSSSGTFARQLCLWWTDPAAALLVAGFAVNEGVDHWRESAPHDEAAGR